MNYDMTIRIVEGVGYLPIVRDWNIDKDVNGEVYRGEYQQTVREALIKCMERVAELSGDKE